ncbi:telomeric repeat-binding factor 2-interacting protein 1-like [Styela clava]
MVSTHDDNSGLFQNEDETPMVFVIRPCSIKAEVKKHIIQGGGLCFPYIEKVPFGYRDNAIFLLPDGEVSWKENTISARYILDSANSGSLMPQERYHCRPSNYNVNGNDAEGRMTYTKTEDINILLYVRDSKLKDKRKLSGNEFWKKLEKQNMFQLKGRSWQSLRDRYLKHLKGRESSYPLEGRVLGPLPTPPQNRNTTMPGTSAKSTSIPAQLDIVTTSDLEEKRPGSFLAEIESRRNSLSPGLSQKEYYVLINDFVKSMQKVTKLDSKSIYKVLFKCNGNEDIAKYYIYQGEVPEGFHLFTDSEDKILLKCLLNPTTCDEEPARKLAKIYGERPVTDRAAALLGVSRNDFNYMQSIPLKNAKMDENN